MGPVSHQRYGCWSEQAPPPLPAKRSGDSRPTREPEVADPQPRVESGRVLDGGTFYSNETAFVPRESTTWTRTGDPPPASFVSVSLSGDDGPFSISDLHAMESSSRYADKQAPETTPPVGSECEDESMAQEVVMDPSKWILLNQETGQELNAQAFVDAIMLLATPYANPFGTNPRLKEAETPLAASWNLRRLRSTGHIARRPSLLPTSIGGRTETYSKPSWQSLPPDVGNQTPQSLLYPVASSAKSSQGRSGTVPGNRVLSSLSAPPNLPTRTSGSSVMGMSAKEGGFSLSKVRLVQVLREVHVGGIRTLCFSPSGNLLATAGTDNVAQVFRVRHRRDGPSGGAALKPSTGALMSLLGAVPDDRKHSAVADVQSDWAIRVMEETPMRVLTGHVGEVVALSWAPDDGVLLTGSADGTVRRWHPQEGDDCVAVYEHGGRVTSVAWDPSSTSESHGNVGGRGRFLTGCMDGKVRIFLLDSAEEEAWFLAEKPVTAVKFAPGGAAFVAGLVGGGVRFFRTEGMVQELSAECRRRGLRQQARHATSPVRRLSVATNRAGGKRKDTGGKGKRQSSSSQGSSKGSSRSTEMRVTGFDFRLQRVLSNGAQAGAAALDSPRVDGETRLDSEIYDVNQSIDDIQLSMSTDSVMEERILQIEALRGNMRPLGRASAAPVTESRGQAAKPESDGKETEKLWLRSRREVLVSTNDSRARVLDTGSNEGVAVRLKFKGHNTEGVLGQHAVASYSGDGELVVSGSTDGYVHVWSAAGAAPVAAPRRGVGWSSHREGHERILISSRKVAVPTAVFAPESIAHNIGDDSTRVIVTGDMDGSVKVFVG